MSREKPVDFKVVAVSKNANAFGLHGHVLIARDGRAFEAARSRGCWNKELNPGDEIMLIETLSEDGEHLSFNWAWNSFEIPRALPNAPAEVIREVFEGETK